MKRSSFVSTFFLLCLVVVLAVACAPAPTATPVPPTAAPVPSAAPAATKASEATKAPAPTATSIRSALGSSGCHLILSTTTSTQDSGLLGFILPGFENKF